MIDTASIPDSAPARLGGARAPAVRYARRTGERRAWLYIEPAATDILRSSCRPGRSHRTRRMQPALGAVGAEERAPESGS